MIDTIPMMSIHVVEVIESPGMAVAQIDELIERWRKAVIDKRIIYQKRCRGKEDLFMRRNFDNFKVIRGVLYRDWKYGENSQLQLVLPPRYRKDVLRGLHYDIGHTGRDGTMSLLRERYFWPGMANDVEKCVHKQENMNNSYITHTLTSAVK